MFDFLSRLKNTDIFQGNLSYKKYFEGWYFKNVGINDARIAVIPGISLAKDKSHAFIQIFNGRTNNSHYFSFSVEEFKPFKNPFSLNISKNRFSYTGIELNINEEVSILGSLNYSDISKYKHSWSEKGVMGWYGYIPFMQTYHGILSLDHRVDGFITINNEPFEYNGGRGYIEKDWGISFPSSWIWMQSNCFETPKTSLVVSIAVIPWLGSSFIGHLALILYQGKIYNLSTYRGGKVTSINYTDNSVSLIIETRKNQLKINAERGASVDLKSPLKGEMTGRTIESLSSTIDVNLISRSDKKSIFAGTGIDAGLEIMDDKKELPKGLGFI
jgi:hypothetical protein